MIFQPGNAAAVTLQLTDQVAVNMSVGYKWKKPICVRLKCSIDLCFSASTNKLGICTCIRDEEGCFVLAKTMWFTLLCSVDVGEDLGLYHAIQ